MADQLESLVSLRTIELQRSNDDLQQFAHVASHDLKEPVRKIRTFGDRLMYEFGEQLPAKAKEYIQKMELSAERIYKMIEGILQYSSIEVNEELNGKVDLNEVIKEISEDLELFIREKKGSISYSNLPQLKGSSTLIHQLFYNLIYNALKFSKKDVPPVITIKSSPWENNSSLITVADNGIGFEQQHAEKIFKTFTRLNNRDKYEGTGLGLSLCKKIVERHGGIIYASGKENEGAVFTLFLPQWKDL
jgi:light-regulated signal transduction histidine kinase (bacteriophytochrome)